MRPKASAFSVWPVARVGKNGGAVQAHGYAALKVCRDNQRQLRCALQPVQQLRGDVGLALQQQRALHRDGHHQRSNVIFAHAVPQLNPGGGGIIQELRKHLDPEELPDFLFR
jgi:hypothetical protein